MKAALVGQPNSGKSTIFNAVAGYKSETSNFPGTTVKYMESRVRINGDLFDLIDFPGTYSLSANNDAEVEVRKHLLVGKFDLVINVVDASQLGRSLPLTLELLDLGIPMMVVLNMYDETHQKGIEIDIEQLSHIIGVPVQVTIASKNIGIKELFRTATKIIRKVLPTRQIKIYCQKDVEEVIEATESFLVDKLPPDFSYPSRFMAKKILEDDDFFIKSIAEKNGRDIYNEITKLQNRLVEIRGKPRDSVMTLEHHAIAMEIYDKVVEIVHPHRDWREEIDNIVMHKLGGYMILILVLVSFFYGVFETGAVVEHFLLTGFEKIESLLPQILPDQVFLQHFARSILWGISGGVAIVLPYLIPFLLVLNLLEDIGYLPRVAFLMDAIMHRIGLHGTSVIPAILGFGCNVPAVMATRILPSRRDKIIAAVVSSMIPCSARSIVIFGLVAFYLGPFWALMIYLFNIIVIGILGKIISLLLPEVSPGMVLEIPPYRLPSLKVVMKKTGFRIKEFITIAWPILIAGSIVLGLLEYFQLARWINLGLSPLTFLLGLPAVVGTTLIFGVLRKELSLVMLTQALGTTNVISILSPVQILTFTIFITFYIPCVATMAVLKRELDAKWMLLIIALTLGIAILLSWIISLTGNLLG